MAAWVFIIAVWLVAIHVIRRHHAWVEWRKFYEAQLLDDVGNFLDDDIMIHFQLISNNELKEYVHQAENAYVTYTRLGMDRIDVYFALLMGNCKLFKNIVDPFISPGQKEEGAI